MRFMDPQVILFVADPERAAAFYSTFGFSETFRTSDADPVKVEMAHGGFALGLATADSARASHGLAPVTQGQRACLTLWTDDVDAATTAAVSAGGRSLTPPHAFLDGKLFVAMVEDLDGHPIQLVQKVRP